MERCHQLTLLEHNRHDVAVCSILQACSANFEWPTTTTFQYHIVGLLDWFSLEPGSELSIWVARKGLKLPAAGYPDQYGAGVEANDLVFKRSFDPLSILSLLFSRKVALSWAIFLSCLHWIPVILTIRIHLVSWLISGLRKQKKKKSKRLYWLRSKALKKSVISAGCRPPKMVWQQSFQPISKSHLTNGLFPMKLVHNENELSTR